MLITLENEPCHTNVVGIRVLPVVHVDSVDREYDQLLGLLTSEYT